MRSPGASKSQEDPLDIQDFLDASSGAASRTRTASVTVVIASVLVFAGLLNSLQHSWMLERVHAANDMSSPYVISKIGSPPDAAANAQAKDAFLRRYNEFYGSLMRSYVDNSYVIRVPFFGFRVDANDLGLLGGIGFVVILIVLRYSISRELDNLRMSFHEAELLGQLPEFYVLLSMRQVFTIPASENIKPPILSRWVPKAICFAPLIVHASVTIHDLCTIGVGHALSDTHTLILFGAEFIVGIAIAILTIGVVERLVRTDAEWDEQWRKVQGSLTNRNTPLVGSRSGGGDTVRS